MRVSYLLQLSAFALQALAQSSDQTAVTLTGTNTANVTSVGGDYATTEVFSMQSSTITITQTGSDYSRASDLNSVVSNLNASATSGGNMTTTQATQSTLLVGGTASATSGTTNQTATSTSSSALPTNTVPCNGWTEFCQRSYSNVTMVAAHNSPFVKPGNAAANQALEVVTQLNDGIRMLQFQTHRVNGTMYMCHTSCDLLNAGPLEDYFSTVKQWLDQNPYEVVTILMGNDDGVWARNYTPPMENSGLIKYVYTAPTEPMSLDDWPTLGEMILTQQRVVVMLDYMANQQRIPWLLEEWDQMWETPFSPTNRDFPCTQQRPKGQDRSVSEKRMYLANHNLNVNIALAGISLDVPAYTVLNETNAVNGTSSAGAMVEECTNNWGRPPNFLLVDYYNIGSYNGSVFQVAATANNVTYNRDRCCGTNQKSYSAAASIQPKGLGLMLVSLVLGYIML